jgi:DNA-binding Lrp family transcriptional regulator
MKSLDVVVLCKIFILQSAGQSNWTYSQLAEETCLSVGEVHASVKRLKKSRLFDEFTKSVIPAALVEFLIHGLKYAFPAEIGASARGIATSHSAPVFRDDVLQSDTDLFVWAYSNGKQKGLSVNPLSKNAPMAAQRDQKLYDFLALIDAVRIGKSREKDIAIRKIENMVQRTAGNGRS